MRRQEKLVGVSPAAVFDSQCDSIHASRCCCVALRRVGLVQQRGGLMNREQDLRRAMEDGRVREKTQRFDKFVREESQKRERHNGRDRLAWTVDLNLTCVDPF